MGMSKVGHDERINRRTALVRGAAALSASCVLREALAAAGDDDPKPAATEAQIRDYLRSLLLSREDVDRWLKQQAFPFCKYDAELGYLHIDREFPEGSDGAVCQYRYDKLGARRMFAHAGEPCRINTYGNSYTSCEQVSDGETWQESLAAHAADAAQFKGTSEEALSRYFVGKAGHYNPLGNHFCAFAIKDTLVKLLVPKPPAYGQ